MPEELAPSITANLFIGYVEMEVYCRKKQHYVNSIRHFRMLGHKFVRLGPKVVADNLMLKLRNCVECLSV